MYLRTLMILAVLILIAIEEPRSKENRAATERRHGDQRSHRTWISLEHNAHGTVRRRRDRDMLRPMRQRQPRVFQLRR